MFDKELQKEYVFCSYLIGLLPKDPVELIKGNFTEGDKVILSALRDKLLSKVLDESGAYTYEMSQNLSMVAEVPISCGEGEKVCSEI